MVGPGLPEIGRAASPRAPPARSPVCAGPPQGLAANCPCGPSRTVVACAEHDGTARLELRRPAHGRVRRVRRGIRPHAAGDTGTPRAPALNNERNGSAGPRIGRAAGASRNSLHAGREERRPDPRADRGLRQGGRRGTGVLAAGRRARATSGVGRRLLPLPPDPGAWIRPVVAHHTGRGLPHVALAGRESSGTRSTPGYLCLRHRQPAA